MKQNVDNPFQSPAILSLCPGFLGLERGLIRAIGPIRVVAYVEIEAFIIANLVAAMELGKLAPAPVWSDIKTLGGAMFRGKIQGIIGGYPCQPFSNAGARNGTSDPRHLYPYISGIIQAAGPVWCFFENVEGHLSLGYPEVSADLRSMGYAVEAGIYSAEEVGAPHQRDRLFILAIKHDFLANAQSAGEWGGSRDIHKKNGRQVGELPLVPGCASGEGVEHTNHNRCDGSENREGDTKGERGDPARAQPVIQFEGSGNSGECETMDNPGSDRLRQVNEIPAGWNGAEFTGEVGDTTIQGQQECRFGMLGKLQAETGVGLHNRPEQPGAAVSEFTPHGRHRRADTDGRRSGQDRELRELRAIRVEQSSGDSRGARPSEDDQRGCNRWPARPGEQQYDWEEPRTATDKEQAERGMGGSIDGYNFREDLLRAYGNGVVEQTVQVAFPDLLDKHFKNYGIA